MLDRQSGLRGVSAINASALTHELHRPGLVSGAWSAEPACQPSLVSGAGLSAEPGQRSRPVSRAWSAEPTWSAEPASSAEQAVDVVGADPHLLVVVLAQLDVVEHVEV